MSHDPDTFIKVAVSIDAGRTDFDPKPGPDGYQFPKHSSHGVLVFTLDNDAYFFTGCRYIPDRGDVPGIEARLGSSCRAPGEIAVRLDFPGGAIRTGQLHLDFMHTRTKKTGVIDPQVGNDGEIRVQTGTDSSTT